MAKIFIIHGWSGSPNEPLHLWMKNELEKRNHEVIALKMPSPNFPKIDEWVSFLQKNIAPDENTYLVGHSIGCQSILRYFTTLSLQDKFGGVLFLAPWINLLETAYENPEEEKKIAKPWIETPINWFVVKDKSFRFTAIFSDDDPCVPLPDSKIFKKNLNAKIIVEKNKGHFSEDTGVNELPSALKEILSMIEKD